MYNWNDLLMFRSESWMMKYMLGLDTRYGPMKRASMESVKEFLGKKTHFQSEWKGVRERMTNRVE